jgi:hypothetical protein
MQWFDASDQLRVHVTLTPMKEVMTLNGQDVAGYHSRLEYSAGKQTSVIQIVA